MPDDGAGSNFFYKIVLIGALLALSGFASASETAFFSLNRFQLRRLRERYRSSYEKIKKLLSKPTRFLILILLLNEIVNIGISTIITSLVEEKKNSIFHLLPWLERTLTPETEWLFITFSSLVITLPLVLFFGEITPKVFAAKMNKIVAILHSNILLIAQAVFYPLLWVLEKIVGTILKGFKAEGRDHLTKTMSILTEDDFVTLMDEGHREGTVHPDERQLVHNVLELDDHTVAEIMTPISQVFCVSSHASVEEILPDIRAQKYSRIPVYQKSRKKIVGMLLVKDLLWVKSQPEMLRSEIRTVMGKKPLMVLPTMRLSALFRKLKQSKTHIAICNDNKGDALGIITMEDVLESIFGEIADERDVR